MVRSVSAKQRVSERVTVAETTKLDPDKAAVLAWLHLNPGATTTDAARKFWPDADELEVRNRAGAIRMWRTRARGGAPAPSPAPPPPAPAKPGQPSPDDEDEADAALSREQWLEKEIRRVSKDLREARAAGQRRDVRGLNQTSRELRAELDELRRSPPPSGQADARPLLSNEQLASLDNQSLGSVISTLVRLGRQGDQATDEEVDRIVAARASVASGAATNEPDDDEEEEG
jgi:hypothetical protein